MHLAPDGSVLSQTDGFYQPRSLAVNPADGSCWVADNYILPVSARVVEYGSVVHLAADGSEIWRNADFADPRAVAVDATDGSCWVGASNGLSHLAADGTLILYRGRVGYPQAVAVDPADRSVWVADARNYQLLHLATDGTEIWVG